MFTYHGQASLCPCHPSGCEEGRSLFADGLGSFLTLTFIRERDAYTEVQEETSCRGLGVSLRFHAVVIARSEATKQSQGGVTYSDERVDCRAFSSLGLENGSQ